MCTGGSDTTFKISVFCLYYGRLGYNSIVISYKMTGCMVAWCHNPEDHDPNFLYSESLKSQVSAYSVSVLSLVMFIILPCLLYDF
jgi:hypothetical protein